MTECRVKTSDGVYLPFDRDKLCTSLSEICVSRHLENVDIADGVSKIQSGLPDEISIDQLVNLIAEVFASMTTIHYEYSKLASVVLSKLLHKKVNSKFSENFKTIHHHEYSNPNRKKKSLFSDDVYKSVMENADIIDKAIVHERDFDIDYFGFRTLEHSYLIVLEGLIHETPQYLFMRVALGIHYNNIDLAIETYELMSQKYFIHASPTLFNSGMKNPCLSSCFLLAMKNDSIDGIYKTLYDTAMISKASGGVGLHISNIRANGTYINGSNGISSGIVPMLQTFNATARYVDQGGNKRPGAFCVYLEPWHADIFQFLDLRKNHGKDEMRTRDLFLALWIPDLFMQKVERNEEWCLFSEDMAPELSNCYGEKFNNLYAKYEQEKRFIKRVNARKLWHAVLVAQTETGNPFLLYKDRCNEMSNQKNLGVIKSSNLCCEIIEYSSPEETAVCNLASLALPTFINNGVFNFEKLHTVAKIVVRNLDRVIDVNEYPLENCKKSNLKNRPIGLGVQGLADTFFKLGFPFDSENAKKLNIQIFETIYHAALEQSSELAIENGKYASYEGSPISKGQLQFDLWGVEPSSLWNWDSLRCKIRENGVRNSLLVALMPTASTSQIFGFNECFEPITSNIYIRRVLSGEHQVVNKYLVDDLMKLDLWNIEMKNKIISNDGSIQNIDNIPDNIKELYKTVWEISQRVLIDLSVDRAPFIDQSQSMNLFMSDVTFSKLTSMHFYAWRKGLKTGMYYLRTKAAASAIKFSLSPIVSRNKRKMKTIDNVVSKFQKVTQAVDQSSDDETDNSSYNIFSKSVISCNLSDPENCDSCSA